MIGPSAVMSITMGLTTYTSTSMMIEETHNEDSQSPRQRASLVEFVLPRTRS